MNKFGKPTKPRYKTFNPVFHVQNKNADDRELSRHLIKLARQSGQLNLSGKGLATVPDKVWHIEELDDSEVCNLDMRLDSEQDEGKWWDHVPFTSLDLSSNSLSELSPGVKSLVSLTSLNIHNNNLLTLPSEIGELRKLNTLNASHNKIKNLPDGLYESPDLRTFNLSYNEIDTIPDTFYNLVMLEHLDLSYNSLSMLLPGIGFLIRLTKLNLSHNQLTEVPPDIVNLRVLRDLSLNDNDIAVLPPLGELRKLELLYLQNNKLGAVPDLIGCESLKELYLANNFIMGISLELMEGLIHLRILDLRDNRLKVLPDEISMLQHLIRLDLTNNDLKSLPTTLGILPHLHTIQLEGNQIRTIRRDILASGTTRIMKFLREKLNDDMDLKDNTVISVSSSENVTFPDKYTMKNTRSLNLALKELVDVPENVFQEAYAGDVSSVDLSKNKFSVIPEGLFILSSKLTELNLSNNQLKCVSPLLGQCCCLQYLDLQNNGLEELPEELSTLQRLRELVLANNRFHSVPECVYEIPSLEILIASGNRIETIEVAGLKQLTRLAVLDFTNNSITQVPPELGNLKQLRSLQLTGNPFRHPRHAILNKGTAEVLSYLRDRIYQS